MTRKMVSVLMVSYWNASEGKLDYTAGKGETGLTALGYIRHGLAIKAIYTDIVLRAGHLDHKMNTYGE